MRWWTFTVGDIQIRFRARSSLEASRLAADFGFQHMLMLIGPRELDHDPVYERPRIY